MSVQSKQGLIAGVCTLALKSQGIPPKCDGKEEGVEHVWILYELKTPLFYFGSAFFFLMVITGDLRMTRLGTL